MWTFNGYYQKQGGPITEQNQQNISCQMKCYEMVEQLNSADVNPEPEESYKLHVTSQTKVYIICSLFVGFSRIER